ncbi:hypothetical protein [Pseudomonas sp. MF6787]|uniref:hypothetical protein n=1 Tax=Pseudomonas sp. MF6787 TaxID=2797536 RepID=UPI0018E82AB6|nr:hypothetical protein [Pseudomonas sp. MF6787]MBJ2261979.1 hypothetical protein [Pseudomonas sp. MF6787]
MKVRFAIISPDTLAQVRTEIERLQQAVNSGDMDGVDAATAQLLELTADCQSIDLSEEDWRAFLTRVRRMNPEFTSNYLLPGEVCASIFPTITADSYVLELPIDGNTAEEEIDV